jgi:hypothetical protein
MTQFCLSAAAMLLAIAPTETGSSNNFDELRVIVP